MCVGCDRVAPAVIALPSSRRKTYVVEEEEDLDLPNTLLLDPDAALPLLLRRRMSERTS